MTVKGFRMAFGVGLPGLGHSEGVLLRVKFNFSQRVVFSVVSNQSELVNSAGSSYNGIGYA